MRPLLVPKRLSEAILKQAIDAYPLECCGILVGEGLDDREGHCVTRLVPSPNISRDKAREYMIDPVIQLETENSLQKGEEVLGFYHSHPNGDVMPSTKDVARSWPDYSYLIVSVRPSFTTSCEGWTFPNRASYERQPIIIVGNETIRVSSILASQ